MDVERKGCLPLYLWMWKRKVVCPCGSKPQVVKAAADRYTTWKAALKQGSGKSKSQTKGKKTIEYKRKLQEEDEGDHLGDARQRLQHGV